MRRKCPHGPDTPRRPSGACAVCNTEWQRRKARERGVPEKRTSALVGGGKRCAQCREVKPLEEFAVASRGLGGRAAYCRPCFAARYYDHEKSRAQTKAWRDANPGRWRAYHRMLQAVRRSSIAVTDDGTVTPEFIETLYETPDCAYCGEFTEPEKRTADHKVPLKKGGLHSASNLVMACSYCNNSKGSKDYEVWIKTKSARAVHCDDDLGLGES